MDPRPRALPLLLELLPQQLLAATAAAARRKLPYERIVAANLEQRVSAPQKPQPWTDFRAVFWPPASWRELKQVVQVAMRHGGLRCDRGAKAEAPRARTTRKGETGRRSEAL